MSAETRCKGFIQIYHPIYHSVFTTNRGLETRTCHSGLGNLGQLEPPQLQGGGDGGPRGGGRGGGRGGRRAPGTAANAGFPSRNPRNPDLSDELFVPDSEKQESGLLVRENVSRAVGLRQ